MSKLRSAHSQTIDLSLSTPESLFRQRYVETLRFGTPDRIPLMPGEPRESTLKAWHAQGLPPGADWWEELLKIIGLPPMSRGLEWLPVSFRMIPEFDEKVLEHRDGHYVVQDWMGAIVEISDSYDLTYLRLPRDFVTRKWHKFPVETRTDWKRMQARFRADTRGRAAVDLAELGERVRTTGAAATVQVNGPFWQLREWCGFENLCTLFLEDPGFVREMIAFWTEFVSRVLARLLRHVPLSRLGISEDMAFKAHSMISPAMSREFLLPAYSRWTAQVREAGCPIIDMDSDGYIGDLIPVWIDAGINVCDPMEVAAHNDIVESRRRFGRGMGYTGGVDKREMAAGGERLEAELARLAPVIRGGGYLPGCDHGVPPDVSWPNFVEYARRLALLTSWL